MATNAKKSTASSRSTASKKSSTGRTSGKKSSTKSNNSRKKNAKDTYDFPLTREVIVLVALAFSILLFISCFNFFGTSLNWLKHINFGLFGCIGYLIPLALFLSVGFLIANNGNTIAKLKIFGGVLDLFAACAIATLIFSNESQRDLSIGNYYLLSKEGAGGGLFGGMIMKFLFPIFGQVGSYVILSLVFILGLVILTERSFVNLVKKQSQKAYSSVKEDMEVHKTQLAVRAEERALRRERQRVEKLERHRQNLERIQEEKEREREKRFGTPVRGIGNTTLKTNGKMPIEPNIVENSFENMIPGNEENQMVNTFTGEIFYGNEKDEKELEETIVPKKEKRARKHLKEQDDDLQIIINNQPAPGKEIILEDVLNNAVEAETPSMESPLYEEEEVSLPFDLEPKEEPEEYKTVVTSSGKVITVELDGVPGERKQPPKEIQTQEKPEIEVNQYREPKEYVFPPITLLKKGNGASGSTKNRDRELRETAIKLQQTLQNFGVGVTVTNISCGPTVTRYELQPEQGVKVSKIVSLTDDIKLNLAAADIRMEAPIPGKAAIGIEVPNRENSIVMFRDLIDSDEFKKQSSKLSFAVGKDIGGQTVVTDIAKMPHLLIAGATGSGKSVCINTLIMSILYKAKPSEVKLIMVDPKVVELSVYNGIPHLMIPVVTDPKKAAAALNWAVAEMTDRYKKFAELNVRDMKGYNDKIDQVADVEGDKPSKLPQIVIIVDELADLMMVAPGEVEDAICRLAQMARAAGIHLVIATQRPSVNVITGLIKANVPSRIAFSVSSGVDSRTIIDMNGAEKLLGKGDMLFYPSGYQKPVRVQCAFVSDTEVSKVVEFLSQQENVVGGEQNTSIDLNVAIQESSINNEAASARDEYFERAAKFIIEKDKASIGMLQRVFKIGFNRAARIMDQLCEAGVVGEEEGTKPRKVLMSLEEFQSSIEENV